MTKIFGFWRYLVIAFVLTAGVVLISPANAEAQARSYVFESIDVTIDQNKDSTMEVTEVLRLSLIHI